MHFLRALLGEFDRQIYIELPLVLTASRIFETV